MPRTTRRRTVAAAALFASLTALTPARAVNVACLLGEYHRPTDEYLWAEVYEDAVGDTVFAWHGGGMGRLPLECASEYWIEVQLVDRAPAGVPPVVQSGFVRINGYRNLGWQAFGEITLPVKYYAKLPTPSGRDDATFSRPRGPSELFLQVQSFFVDAATGETVPLPCEQASWRVLPAPDGPVLVNVAGLANQEDRPNTYEFCGPLII